MNITFDKPWDDYDDYTHSFLPLLAATGAASVPQKRVFSFEFFAKQYCFTQGDKFATVKIRVWALFQFTEGNYMLLFFRVGI